MQDYRCYLKAILRQRSHRNPRYSLRAFARDLSIAPSLLSLLINRKASLTLSKAMAIAECLDISADERNYFIALVERERSGRKNRVIALRQKHAFEAFEPKTGALENISPEDFAFMLIVGLLGGIQNNKETANAFGMNKEQLERHCERLQRLGRLKGCPVTGWAAAKSFINAEAKDSSASIRAYHQKVLEIALKQLHEREAHERYFRSVLFSYKEADYPALCRDIQEFCEARCDAYSSRDTHDRIYVLGVQLLPVGQVVRPVAGMGQA